MYPKAAEIKFKAHGAQGQMNMGRIIHQLNLT